MSKRSGMSWAFTLALLALLASGLAYRRAGQALRVSEAREKRIERRGGGFGLAVPQSNDADEATREQEAQQRAPEIDHSKRLGCAGSVRILGPGELEQLIDEATPKPWGLGPILPPTLAPVEGASHGVYEAPGASGLTLTTGGSTVLTYSRVKPWAAPGPDFSIGTGEARDDQGRHPLWLELGGPPENAVAWVGRSGDWLVVYDAEKREVARFRRPQ